MNTEHSLDADINTGNFAEASGLMVGDDVDLFFHYFLHVVREGCYTMSLGACFSRLLFSDYHSIRKYAAFVVLAPIAYDNNTMTPSNHAALTRSEVSSSPFVRHSRSVRR